MARVVGARDFPRHVLNRRFHVPWRSNLHIRSESEIVVSENGHKQGRLAAFPTLASFSLFNLCFRYTVLLARCYVSQRASHVGAAGSAKQVLHLPAQVCAYNKPLVVSSRGFSF